MRNLPLILLLLLTLTPGAPAQISTGEAGLDQQIHAALQGFPGEVSLYAKNLKTGVEYGLKADEPVQTASTIKLPIMIELFAEANEGKLDWNQRISLTEEDKVSGSGILFEFSGGDSFTLRDLMHVMIVVSDNTATNLLLDRVGGDAVNARMAQLGLKQTAVMKKIMRPSGYTAEGRKAGSDKWGLGRSSPHDMVLLLEKLHRGELVSKAASEEMLKVLKRQQNHNGAGRDIMNTIDIASKAGALDHLRSDVAILYVKNGPVAMAITVTGIPVVDYGADNQGDLLIAKLGQILVDALAPDSAAQSKTNP